MRITDFSFPSSMCIITHVSIAGYSQTKRLSRQSNLHAGTFQELGASLDRSDVINCRRQVAEGRMTSIVAGECTLRRVGVDTSNSFLAAFHQGSLIRLSTSTGIYPTISYSRVDALGDPLDRIETLQNWVVSSPIRMCQIHLRVAAELRVGLAY